MARLLICLALTAFAGAGCHVLPNDIGSGRSADVQTELEYSDLPGERIEAGDLGFWFEEDALPLTPQRVHGGIQ